MKAIRTAVYAALIALPAVALAEDSKLNCDNVNIGEDVLAQFPKIREACHGVTTRGTDEAVYVHLVGTVHSVSKEQIAVDMEGRDGKPISRITVAPTGDLNVKTDGKSVKFSSLKKGQRIDLWAEHKKWGLYSEFDTPAITIVSREEL